MKEEELKEKYLQKDTKQENKKDILEEVKEREKETIEKVEEQSEKEEEIIVEEKTDNQVEKKEKRINKRAIIIGVIAIIVLIVLSTIFAIFNMSNSKIAKGTYIHGIDVSDLTMEEAKTKIEQKIEEIQKRDITLIYDDYSVTMTPEQIELNINFEEALKEAQKIGRTNNILVDNYAILKANIFKTNINAQLTYNKEILLDIIKNVDAELPGALKNVSYEVNEDKLIITKGKDGIVVKTEKLEEQIIENIEKQLRDVIDDIYIPTEKKAAEAIDIESIYHEVYKEAKDAYIEENPFKLHVEETGLDFKITMEEAKQIISEEKETYEIPLKITKPKVKTEDLGNKLFKQTLAKYTTIYDAGNVNRGTNIALAAKTINGTILLPGETFSYNKILGNTTKEKGYQLGTAYVGGKTVPSYGGGICQVSSTLYNAALYANLEIVERYNHSYAVSYVPAGRDATVAYGGKDFKFKNTRNYPIKIVASAKNGVVSISLAGIKEEKEYEIELRSTVLSRTPCKVVYQDNSSLAEGKQKIIQSGYNGLKSKAYKIVKYNGKTISKTLLSSDTYQPMDRIIERGTKKAASKKPEKEDTKQEENKAENKTEQTQPEVTE